MVAVVEQEIEVSDWRGCYRDSWQGEIVADSFAHPAKFSRGLIRRIYQHAIEEGWLVAGDSVIDCFGGVALGALDAMRHGLNWTGCELEEKFVVLGNQNIDLWSEYYQGRLDTCGSAQLIQGDSRMLASVIEQARCCVSSPPWGEGAEGVLRADKFKDPEATARMQMSKGHGASYEAKLAAMKRENERASYGCSEGNLGNLKATDEGLQAVISSPPYACAKAHPSIGSVNQPGWGTDGGDIAKRKGLSGDYGETSGQLASMSEGDLQAVISSPPFAECLATNPPNKEFERKRQKQRGRNPDSPGAGADADYGQSEGQLGAMREGNLAAVISSPPFVESLASDDPDKRGGMFKTDPKRRNDKTLTATYGETEGNLGRMKAVVSSPPFESSVNRQGEWNNSLDPQKSKYPQNRSKEYVKANQFLYGESAENIGNSQGDSFWAAARLIVEQVHSVLSPNAHAIWVVKGFIRNKQYVDFPAQWQALCEAVGFKTLHIHRCWLVEHHGEQSTFFGEAESIETHRKSFFRRLAESKGSPPIDYEVVLCMQRKPLPQPEAGEGGTSDNRGRRDL